MVLYYPDLVRFDPMRALDWRWQRAQSLLDNGSCFRRDRDDEDTGRAVRYLRAVRRSRDAGESISTMKVKPQLVDIHRAHQLHAAANPQTTVVQARLLARQSVDEIGALVSLAPAVIDAYEALFFNVVNRLGATFYIAKLAIRWTSAMAAAGCDVDAVLRWIAYFGGPTALDLAVPVLMPRAAAWYPTLAPVAADRELAMTIRALAAVMMMPQIEWRDQMKLLRLRTDLIKMPQLEGAAENVSLSGVFEELVRETVSELSQKCFLPVPKPRKDFGDERPAVAGEGASRVVA